MIRNKGFTLIELLAVVAIIGVLSTVVIAGLSEARAKGRDAKRISDIKNIEIALKLYSADHNARYPTNLSVLVTDRYLPSEPKDPRGASYSYAALRLGGAPADCVGFHLGATLETAHAALFDDSDESNTGTNGQTCTSSGSNFHGLSNAAPCGTDIKTALTSANQGAAGTERCYDVRN